VLEAQRTALSWNVEGAKPSAALKSPRLSAGRRPHQLFLGRGREGEREAGGREEGATGFATYLEQWDRVAAALPCFCHTFRRIIWKPGPPDPQPSKVISHIILSGEEFKFLALPFNIEG